MEEALRLAQEAEQDAAILDLKLGGAVVFPVAEVLRNRTIPFTFATGYGSTRLPPPFRDSPTLPKPFSYQSLADALRVGLAGQPCHSTAA